MWGAFRGARKHCPQQCSIVSGESSPTANDGSGEKRRKCGWYVAAGVQRVAGGSSVLRTVAQHVPLRPDPDHTVTKQTRRLF